jgi:hypothetical protein
VLTPASDALASEDLPSGRAGDASLNDETGQPVVRSDLERKSEPVSSAGRANEGDDDGGMGEKQEKRRGLPG